MTRTTDSGPGRVYAACLHLLPRDVRDRYGPEMVAMFEDAWRDASRVGRARLAARAARDLVVSAAVLRTARVFGRRASRPPGPGRGTHRPEAVGAAWRADLLHAFRSLVRRPVFTGLVVLTLLAGLGVNAAIFGFVNGLLLRPLPYADPGRLVQLSETAPELGTMDLSLPDFALWRAETRVFTGMFAFDDTRFLLEGPGVARPVEGAVVSPGFLEVLGVRPALGRGFSPEEAAPGADAAVILGNRLWVSRFGGRPDVVGSSIELNGRPHVVVGVAPAGFHFPEVADLWVPLAFDAASANPEDYGFDAIGRLARDFGLDDALHDGERIAALLAAAHPTTKSGLGVDVYPLRYADVPGGLAGASAVLLAAVCLVLLVACSNVAHMLLARAEGRSQELLVRRALGASPGALVRQPLLESAFLAGIGVAGALVVAGWSGHLLGLLLPEERPFWMEFGVDGRVLAWTCAVGAAVCLVTGAAPAAHAARSGQPPRGGRHVTERGRRWLIRAQVAVASFLVVAAGATTRALHDLRTADPGLDPHHVLVIHAVLPPWDYPDARARRAAAGAILSAVRTLPDVAVASAVESVPFVGSPDEVALDTGAPTDTRPPVGVLNAFSGRYFDAVGTPLLRGRVPTPVEDQEGAPVAVVSASMAARLWPGEDPLGQRVRHGAPGARSPTVPDDQPWLEVVGVVGDVRQAGPGRPVRGQLYVPLSRLAPTVVSLVMRTRDDAMAAVPAVRTRLAHLDAGIAVLEPTTLTTALGSSLWTERLASLLLAALGTLALFLALVGVYAVVAYSVRRRERELRIRVALGASGARIRTAVLVDTLALVAPGLILGLMAGGGAVAAAGRVLGWMHVLDLRTLLATAALFLAAGLVASHPSAARAARLDPGRALRAE